MYSKQLFKFLYKDMEMFFIRNYVFLIFLFLALVLNISLIFGKQKFSGYEKFDKDKLIAKKTP